MPGWLTALLSWLAHSAWPRVWGALIGAAIGQAVAYVKLRARLEAHHVAQLAHARRQHLEVAAASDARAAVMAAQVQQLSEDVARLAGAAVTQSLAAQRPEGATVADGAKAGGT